MRTPATVRVLLVAGFALGCSGCMEAGEDLRDPTSGYSMAWPELPWGNSDGAWEGGRGQWPSGVVVRPEPEVPPVGGNLEGLDADDEASCRNDVDDDLDGLVDCQEPACSGEPSCCVELGGPWVASPEACLADGPCEWTVFTPAVGGGTVTTTETAVLLGGDGGSEVGLYSAPSVGLTGRPTLTFRAMLTDAGCSAGDCRQALGAAIIEGLPSAGTGVTPEVGIVLDGELPAVHLYVGGRLSLTEPVDLSELLEERGYGLRVEADGRVSFWSGLSPDDLPATGAPTIAPSHVSTARVDTRRSGLRLAAWGRVDGAPAARLVALHLDRLLCPQPESWARVAEGPVLRPEGSAVAASRLAVLELDDGAGNLAVFESDGRLELARSDDGISWAHGGPIFTDSLPPTEYGRVARRAPALLSWAPPHASPQLHLWFEAIAELGEDAPDGVTPTAIVHAVSTDGGVTWREDSEGSVAIEGVTADTAVADDGEGPGLPRWRWTVEAPTVTVNGTEGLAMWFVGRDPVTGRTSLGFATSEDGKDWDISPTPARFDSTERLSFERDGIDEPVVVYRGAAFHLWYVGRAGARSAIGYAVSSDGTTWDRYGPVLEASVPWEEHSVSGPAVIVVPGTETDLLRLWYAAGSRGRETVGIVEQLAPAL